MTRQTSIQLDANTEALIAFLKDRGYGTTTNIIREAIKRMAEQEGHAMYTKYTMTTGSRGEPVVTTEVWTDGRDERHDTSFASSAWGREVVEAVPADAEVFGRGAWRRTVTYYPE